MTCRDALQLLYDHVEGRLDPATSQSLEQHMADCPGCLAFLKTYQNTIRLSGQLRPNDIPPELQQRLLSFLKRRSPKQSTWWQRLRARLLGRA